MHKACLGHDRDRLFVFMVHTEAGAMSRIFRLPEQPAVRAAVSFQGGCRHGRSMTATALEWHCATPRPVRMPHPGFFGMPI
jgi:hypothetical protein